MGLENLYTDLINKLSLIPKDCTTIIPYSQLQQNNSSFPPTPVQKSQTTNNFQKTQYKFEQKFSTINIWNDQIDNEVKSIKRDGTNNGYIIKCPAVFVEFVPNDGNQIGGGVTQYMDACIYFHIFSDELNTSNNKRGLNQNPADLIDANFEIFKLRDIISSYFLGYHPNNGSALMSRYDKPDYKHLTITKYLRGFSFCWNDDKGSVFDPISVRYSIGVPFPANNAIVPENVWQSGISYVALVNVVYYGGLGAIVAGFYLCLSTNTDITFNPLNWQLIALWVSGTTYNIGNYIYNSYYVYQCKTENSDVDFNTSNWNLITRI